MAILPRLRQDILDNPVALAEYKHIARAGTGWFWRILYVLTVFALLLPLLYSESEWFHRSLNDIGVFLLMLNFTATLAVELRAINLADRSMSREHSGGTWELLVMTGVDTWRVVMGKWLGVMRGVRRDFLYLFVLRIASLFWLLGLYSLNEIFTDYWKSYYPYDAARLSDIQVDLGIFVIASIIMGLFLLVEMGLVTALPMGFSLFKWTRKQSAAIALTLRIAVPIMYGLFICWQAGWFEYYRTPFDPRTYSFTVAMVVNLGDQGLMSVGSMFSEDSRLYLSLIGLAQALGFISLIGITFFLLRFAKYAAFTQNVSEPGFVPKVKPKREIRVSTEKAVQPVVARSASLEQTEATSLFDIPNAGLYRCVVSDYSNQQLTVMVYPRFKTEAEYKILFHDVSYHAGAMTWDSANFTIFDETERKTFMRKMGLSESDITPSAKLYGNSSAGSAIRIMAGSVEIMPFQ